MGGTRGEEKWQQMDNHSQNGYPVDIKDLMDDQERDGVTT